MKKILIASVVAFAAISAVGISKVNSGNTQTHLALKFTANGPITIERNSILPKQLVLDFKNPQPVKLTSNKIVVIPGFSNEEIRIAQENEQKNKTAKQTAVRTIQKTQTPVICKVSWSGNFDELYQGAGNQYGVPWQVLAAVHSVESGQSGDTARANPSGASGPMQFMPRTWRAYGVDADGDGVAKITSVVDSVYAAAHYISANMNTTGSLHGALYQYNHSIAYVNRVLAIARSFGYGG